MKSERKIFKVSADMGASITVSVVAENEEDAIEKMVSGLDAGDFQLCSSCATHIDLGEARNISAKRLQR